MITHAFHLYIQCSKPLNFYLQPKIYLFLLILLCKMRVIGYYVKMLGGLNPSTDLLVGSTSQYGPVLTELPSQLKSSKIDEVSTALPMSDQEEETHTLMDDVQLQQQTTGGPSTIAGQIPGWVRADAKVNLFLPLFSTLNDRPYSW